MFRSLERETNRQTSLCAYREKAVCLWVLCQTVSGRQTLQVHENVHTGVKPYPCPECKASFTLKSNMTRHLKMKHRDEDTVDETENVAVPVVPSLRNRTFIVASRNQDAPRLEKEPSEKAQNWALENFVILKKLGRGKFGKVYEVKEEATGWIAAIKMLSNKELSKT